ncbi:hypothetical protein Moror_3255 [Moniliophthora roreri MCA 2997]|uniref:Uncharacterized protein n=2 Tax=Moniliophthora roreri TaxID=221103 RepID=V2XQD1_MONRO|nr:hypothetical protein Moror_3255 [Moniliophthora roreri MCA 2997]KAI3621529.1 hypothetical protein WG66_017027 [Moniliophthora roreri]
MNVFNPNIIDASLRDVASCLSDNQKADLLLYAMKTLTYEGRSRIIFENAIQSCLQMTTLSPEYTAKARIMRARARLGAGSLFGAQEDLQAALVADPDNPEAMALLHQRSVNVEKLLAPQPPIIPRSRFSPEIWREIATFLPRKDLKTLLLVPNPVSRIASQLLFRQLDLHFSSLSPEYPEEETESWSGRDLDRERHAQRSADILARIITDSVFASVVRTLRVFSFRMDGDAAIGFQIGVLSNALPKLINLQNVHITAPVEGALSLIRILEFTHHKLRGFSLKVLDGALDLSTLNFSRLSHFSYETNYASAASSSSASNQSAGSAQTVTAAPSTTLFISQNNISLRKLSLQTPSSGFPPTDALALRNLTHLSFTGCVPASVPNLLPDILTHGRQLESLSLTILVDCMLSPHFRAMSSQLPFLRHFAFAIGGGVSRRLNDRDLFPSLAEFLRDRKELRSLTLTAPCTTGGANSGSETIQRLTGFDSGVWGVLPTLTGLKALTISWPRDLAPGLGGWLIPRSVKSLVFDAIGGNMVADRDPGAFLNQLRPGIPSSLVYVGLMDFPLRSPAQIIEQGFPMVKLLRLGNTYWTVKSNLGSRRDALENSPTLKASSAVSNQATTSTQSTSASSSVTATRPILPSRSLSHTHTPGYSHTSTTYHPSPASVAAAAAVSTLVAPTGSRPILPSRKSTTDVRVSVSQIASGSAPQTGRNTYSTASSTVELEQWPRRRAAFHLSEWFEWLDCAEGLDVASGEFGI